MYSNVDCHVRALEIDATDGRAWANLGNTMATGAEVTVKDQKYTKQACYIRALELDPLLEATSENRSNLDVPHTEPL